MLKILQQLAYDDGNSQTIVLPIEAKHPRADEEIRKELSTGRQQAVNPDSPETVTCSRLAHSEMTSQGWGRGGAQQTLSK